MQIVDKERTFRLSLGEEKNMVTQLLLINITVYIGLFFTWVLFHMENMTDAQFQQNLYTHIIFHAEPGNLLKEPWTLVTSLFTHYGVFNTFSSLLWMWFFGSIVQTYVGHEKIIPLYLFAGWAGLAVFMLGGFVMPSWQQATTPITFSGAWGATAGFAVAALMIAPKHRIFSAVGKGGIPVWLIGIIYFVLVLGANYNVTGNRLGEMYFNIAGGAFMGFIYAHFLQKGFDIGAWLHNIFYKITHLFHPKSEMPSKIVAQQVAVTKETVFYKQDTAPYQKVGSVSENKLNEILDKINANGLESLSDEEKETLERASKTAN
ncbi:membrane associated rhomboid family serine protease [Chitinophaga skermanii]|uniref:Membrane associated rhomboid family serine protease n=1 Tax=Chitinophaga skermanii TaxID=331697 RepID=A0A327Q477_9BACT|nr:rhomboid family intramembrane serine protease [Chitinophaga skermanii]RAI98763.1 membrane associated rhomboid family serine protease [Chitinophaga skermanii]